MLFETETEVVEFTPTATAARPRAKSGRAGRLAFPDSGELSQQPTRCHSMW
jgi:hypothetical protein